MKPLIPILFIVLSSTACLAQRSGCLPPNIDKNDIASIVTVTDKEGGSSIQKITVERTLEKIGARCSRDKLVDSEGREVRFYFVEGCWGNPPADYLEILRRQQKELEQLRRSYAVVEMTCDPRGKPPQSISGVLIKGLLKLRQSGEASMN